LEKSFEFHQKAPKLNIRPPKQQNE